MNVFLTFLKKQSLIIFLFLPNIVFAQNISINEFMASNSTTITDPDFNAYADWIEIYNSGPAQVNLKNYYLTDDLSQPQKFKIQIDLIIECKRICFDLGR